MSTVILNDPGGTIGSHVAYGALLKALHAKVIVAYCASACLMLLAQLDPAQVCFRPSAWIGWHPAPWGSPMQWERGRAWIARGWRGCRR